MILRVALHLMLLVDHQTFPAWFDAPGAISDIPGELGSGGINSAEDKEGVCGDRSSAEPPSEGSRRAEHSGSRAGQLLPDISCWPHRPATWPWARFPETWLALGCWAPEGGGISRTDTCFWEMVPLINMEEFLRLRLHPHTITPEVTGLPPDSHPALDVVLKTTFSTVLHHCGVKEGGTFKKNHRSCGFVRWSVTKHSATSIFHFFILKKDGI